MPTHDAIKMQLVAMRPVQDGMPPLIRESPHRGLVQANKYPSLVHPRLAWMAVLLKRLEGSGNELRTIEAEPGNVLDLHVGAIPPSMPESADTPSAKLCRQPSHWIDRWNDVGVNPQVCIVSR